MAINRKNDDSRKEPMIGRAMTVEDVFTKSGEERRIYELREKGRRDYENAMWTFERRGEQRGEQRGERRGEQKIMRSMLASGMSPEQIAKITGFSTQEIEALR